MGLQCVTMFIQLPDMHMVNTLNPTKRHHCAYNVLDRQMPRLPSISKWITPGGMAKPCHKT